MLRPVFLLFLVAAASGQHTPIDVAIYYESYCPDSRNFIIDQLAPTYWMLGPAFFKIDYVPWGHANFTEEPQPPPGLPIECQHEQIECHGNAVMACALPALDSVTQTVFIECVMSRDSDFFDNVGPCASEVGLTGEDLLDCSVSEFAIQALLQNEKKTKNAIPEYPNFWVPAVTLNGEILNPERHGFFLHELCERIDGF